jgi:hypothetical protein
LNSIGGVFAMHKVDRELQEILKERIEDEDIIANLSAFQRRMYYIKHLCYYELFKKVCHLPGDIVELGVYKGNSLMTFARLVETFCTGDRTKTVWGFDHFQGLIEHGDKDGTFERVGNVHGGWNPANSKSSIFKLVELFNQDSFVPAKPRLILVDGDVKETVPQWLKENPGARLSMLHFDMDLYEPTIHCLNSLYERVIPGGIVIFDEAFIKEWPGETSAFEEFFQGNVPKIKKFDFSSAPGAYIVKE